MDAKINMTNGSITISRPRQSATARIVIRDNSTGTDAVVAEITLENLAAALLGLSDVPCAFELSPVGTDPTRFVNGCTCRPVWITDERYMVAGEADCSVHGYGEA